MLSLFPGLLFLAPIGVTLLRILAGLTLTYVAYRYAMERSEIAHLKLPIVGHLPKWLSIIGALIVFAAAVFLVIGLYTQAAAIAGMLVALKDAIFAKRYSKIAPLSRDAAILLFVICLSLLFSGAGAFAFDLPL